MQPPLLCFNEETETLNFFPIEIPFCLDEGAMILRFVYDWNQLGTMTA